jgi:uncharacterized protein with NRDE domain
MCIVFFVKDFSPAFPLIIAFNRDESIWRESAPLSTHEVDGQDLLYGTDMKTLTTWFGVNKTTGNFAFLTNSRFREHYQ